MATKLKRKYTCRPKHRRLKRTHRCKKNTKKHRKQKGGGLVDTMFGVINSRNPFSKTIIPMKDIREEQLETIRETEANKYEFDYIVFCFIDSFKSNILRNIYLDNLIYKSAYEFHNYDQNNVFNINEPINFENVGFQMEFRRPISNAYGNIELQNLLLNRLIVQEDENGVENLNIENLFFEDNIIENIILSCGYDNTFKLTTMYSFENIDKNINITTSGFINNLEDLITKEHEYVVLNEICTILKNIEIMVNDKTIIQNIEPIKIESHLKYDVKSDSTLRHELSSAFIFKEFGNFVNTKLFPIYDRIQNEIMPDHARMR